MWTMWDMVLDYLGDMLDLQRGVIIFIEDVLFDIFGWSLQLLEGSGAKHDTRIAHHWTIVQMTL